MLGDKHYIVEVNHRPTTSIIGMRSVIDAELGPLIVDARYSGLPDSVVDKGAYSFTKKILYKSIYINMPVPYSTILK